MKKAIAVMLAIVTLMLVVTSGVYSAFAASNPTWTMNNVSNLSATDAKISSRVKFSSKITCTESGFYIGTSQNNLKKNANPDKNLKITSTYIDSSFLMSKYKETLKPNTTYYYQIYVVANGKTYKSPVKSFKTVALSTVTATWTMNNVSNLSATDAKISSRVKFSSNITCTESGFYIGTSQNNLKKNANPDKNLKITSTYIDSSFLMSKYKETLKPNTTYYYQIYVVANGKIYKSPVKSFKTVATSIADAGKNAAQSVIATPTEIFFPLPKNIKWKGRTYKNHGNANTSARSSIDIFRVDDRNCKGTPVYAVESGEVIRKDAVNGEITIKHTKKLITTNGAVYNTWYSDYAHMENIKLNTGDKVTRGQQIGTVGRVGNATAEHLHFHMSSGNNGANWYYKNGDTDRSISPYYVKGFVAGYKKETGYFTIQRTWKLDPEGAFSERWLINHVPNGV